MALNQPIVTKTVPTVLPRLADEQVIALAELLRLLGEPARLRVLLACVAGPASVGKIAIRAELPRALVSHHLRLLRAGQFLRAARNGKQMIYSLADERVLCILADLIGHVVNPGDDDE